MISCKSLVQELWKKLQNNSALQEQYVKQKTELYTVRADSSVVLLKKKK